MFIILLLLLFGFLYFEDYLLSVSKYEIKGPEDFKIIHLSDLHSTLNEFLTKQIINKINNEKPDYVVISGDLIDIRSKDPFKIVNELNKVDKTIKILFAPGNHDLEDNTYYEKLCVLLKENNVIILDNDKVEYKNYNIYGIKDYFYTGKRNFFIDKLNVDNKKYSILISHRPELFDDYVSKNINLVLTGHAHGGQFRIFNKGLFAPQQGILPKYTAGVFKKENTNMIVSRGIGNSGFPVRLFNRPELIIINITK